MFVYFIYVMIDPYILVIPARYAQHEILKRNYINLQICIRFLSSMIWYFITVQAEVQSYEVQSKP